MKYRVDQSTLFYRLLSLSLFSLLVEEFCAGTWEIHSGQLYPWRHFAFVPLYGTTWLFIEWLLLGVGALLLLFSRTRSWGTVFTGVSLVFGFSQRVSNHRLLMLLVLLYLVFFPVQLKFKAVRYQLLLVYLFAAVHKMNAAFLSGEVFLFLSRATHDSWAGDYWVRQVLAGPEAHVLAWMIIGFELLIPVLLLRSPWFGFVGVGIMHLGFSLFIPGIWCYSFLMIAMASLFLGQQIGPGLQNRNAQFR